MTDADEGELSAGKKRGERHGGQRMTPEAAIKAVKTKNDTDGSKKSGDENIDRDRAIRS